MSPVKRAVLRYAAAIGIAAAILGTVVGARHRDEGRRYAQLRAAAQSIRLDLERWAVDTDGSYPLDALAALSALPDNPFVNGSTMTMLMPGDPWQPGAFVYLAAASRYTPKDGVTSARWLTGAGAKPADGEAISDYALVFYGKKGKPYLRNLAALDLSFVTSPRDPAELGFDPVPAGIDWEHVSYMLTSQSDSFL